MTMKLYEIDRQLERLVELDTERMVDTETGEILTVEALAELQMDRLEKIEGCLLVIKNKEAEAEAIQAEIDKLTARKKKLDKKAQWLRGYVTNSLNGEKFETARVSVWFKPSTKVEVTCSIDTLPEIYRKETITYSPDKKALKQALEQGIVITGVQIVKNSNIQIN